MMINTLLEHVPIKLEAPDNGDEEDAENNSKQKSKIVKMNGKNVVVEEDGSGDDDEEDDEDTDEDDSETDLLEEDDDDATLVPISSDEEAELEAQRIRFPELIGKNLHLTALPKDGKKTKSTKKLRERSVSSCASVSSKTSIASCSSASSIADSKYSNQSDLPKQKQKSDSTIKKTVACRNIEKGGASTESEAEHDDITVTYKRPLRNRVPSTCSVASSLVTPSCQTESCGNIYVYEEQQKLIFNCSFCDLRYGDMTSFAKHLHNAHKLFQEEEDVTSTITARKSPRTQTKQQAESKAQAQDNKLKVVVKTEMKPHQEECCDDNSSAHSMSPIPVDATLESCGNVFILNGKKLFLICGHCECKYATLDLFHKHLRQQHQLFSGPVKEIDVLPKSEIKVELRGEGEQLPKVSAAALAIERQRKASIEAMIASPVMVVLPVAQNVDNNDILPATVSVQVPETPPPEEDKTVEESTLNTANKQKVVTEKTFLNETICEADNAKKVVDDNEKQLRVEEHAQSEAGQQVHATGSGNNENAHKTCAETVEDGNSQELKPVVKRKRKRRSVFSKRSPPKKRAAATKDVSSHQNDNKDESNTDDAIKLHSADDPAAERADTTPCELNLVPVSEVSSMETGITDSDVKTLTGIVEDAASTNFTANIEEVVSEANTSLSAPEIKKQKGKTAEKIKIPPKPTAKRTRKKKAPAVVEEQSVSLCKTGTKSKSSSPECSVKSSLDLESTIDAKVGTSKPIAHVMRTTCYSETQKLRFACNQCPKSFSKSTRLAEHKRLHTGEKPFSCEECGKTFRIKRRLIEHKMRHLKVKTYKCETCGLPVATKQDLRLHQRHHTNDRRYPCTECSKAFVRSTDLKIHKRVHTGEKPFVCEICQKTFRANQNLLVHRRSHMGEKNYKCDYCDKRFMRNIDRKVHHRTHTGERPFKCEICGRCYSSRAHVRTHIQREHVENGGDTKPERKKNERKTKPAAVDEIVKEQQLIDEIQEQILQCLKTDDLDEEELSPTPTATTTTIVKPAEIKKQRRGKSTPRTSPALKNGVDIDLPHQVQQHAQSRGVQQVSVTVSMQMQDDVGMADEPMPEKENATTLVGAVSASLSKNTKSERKISSYFSVLGQKTEI
ncbi:uncharacterized protein LOC105223974 [Bactrocera dorsalis]|uniref:Uncharacterized protein LOC105223974 n=1 Tax=Bactrocera dorsalis TaxID=27457 RepID=A0A6I9URY6_BACDO|nr:uncharacterized protein LOC105223974 [Bactrocera dorsalis]